MTTIEAGLRRVAELAGREHWLAVLVTIRPDGEPSTSVVNAGILPHPTTGEPVVALVSRGDTAKLRNLAGHPRATLVFRAGWEWISVAGPAEVVGPEAGAEPLRLLLRDVYHAAGGVHPDLEEYDRAMVEDGRVAVLIRPERFATNS
ncbi:TIGR03618 family F420-dependent PPOX class oxidoreductase [Dactylosporangium sp. NPDC000521]|uniref:TIGR03618 family F420-dependent PPOX class oxidoreductase n=1 Tax=Dactylosporangium sp. NPDC000521 TaxID=3363975 RepID=UPI00369D9175